MTARLMDVKQFFFDRDKVVKLLDRKSFRTLKRFGLLTRRIAKNSIKRAPKTNRAGAPKPGSPPRSITGLLKQHIYASFDPKTRSVTIGPIRLNGRTPQSVLATEVLERGGLVIRDGKSLVYKQRPYMGPAFTKAKQSLTKIIKES